MSQSVPRAGEVGASWRVARPVAAVEAAVRLGPDRLFRAAFAESQERSGLFELPLFSRGELEVGHYCVGFDFASATRAEVSGAVLDLRWHPRRDRPLLPSGEGDVVVRPADRPGSTELALVARYRPPAGLLGLVVDHLVGRRLSSLAARTFLQRIGEVLELPPESTMRRKSGALRHPSGSCRR